MGKTIGKFWTTSKREQLLCQYHDIWENKKSPPVQTERVKQKGKGNITNASIALKSMRVNKTHFIVLSQLIVISLFERNLSTHEINK